MMQQKKAIVWIAILTLLIEFITISARVFVGKSSEEFNKAHPLPLFFRMHHFIHGLIILLIAFLIRNPTIKQYLIIVGLSLFFSDMIHHFIYSPIVFGTISWHWP